MTRKSNHNVVSRRHLRSLVVLALMAFPGTMAGQAQLPSQPKAAKEEPTVQASGTPAKGETHSLTKEDLDTWLDGLVPFALKNGDIAGAVIVVVKDGKVLSERGFGYADVRRKIPMDPARTMVRPGSTSKLFTWTAVMQLVQSGKLDLNRDINDYLDFKIPEKFGKPITMLDLMNHRAGFEEGLKDILATDPRYAESNEQYLKTHPRPMLFPPGEVPAYSNYGAALAGYIVQRVSSEPFERYVEQHIFLPLGMNHSTFEQPLPERFKDQVAQGYRTASSPPQPYELVITRPAGSMTTTADDMSKFMLAHLQHGRLGDYQMLSPETTDLMHSPSETGIPGFATMAHGMFYQTWNGRTAIGHGGDTVVFHTELELLPKENVGIFYSFNSRGRNDAVYGLRQGLFEGFMDRYFPAPPATDPPTMPNARRDAQEIAGRYQSSRRVEHGFISLFYLLQQSSITANPDGTINAAGEAGQKKYHEIGAQIWRQVGGTRQLALRRVSGVKTVIGSEDPTSVLQAVPPLRSAPLNLTVLIVSVAILLWTVVLWPLAALLRRADRATSGVPGEVRRLRRFACVVAIIDLLYLLGWFLVLQPVLKTDLQVYGPALDPIVRTMQIAGILIIATACVGIWIAWRMFNVQSSWLSRIWTVGVAAALIGVVWIGFMGQLISFSLNY
jgi:CubicO group peptidase (beta-lactamase class C family)